MQRTINSFRKTNHFMYRQWDRIIEDDFLAAIVKQVQLKRTSLHGKVNVIIGYRYLNTLRGICKDLPILKKHECIILIVSCDRLVTAYKSEEKNHHYLLQQLRVGEKIFL